MMVGDKSLGQKKLVGINNLVSTNSLSSSRVEKLKLFQAGVLDTIKSESATQTFFPSIATLKLNTAPIAPTAPGTKKSLPKLITEFSLPALDFTGGYFSRASRTKRFNLDKGEKLIYTKKERKEDRIQAARKKVAARGEIELA